MSLTRIPEGETPQYCSCHGRAVMLTITVDTLIVRRVWHGEEHVKVMSRKEITDFWEGLDKRIALLQNPNQVNT